MEITNGTIYTLNSDGVLIATDINNGEKAQIFNDQKFCGVKILRAMDGYLFFVELESGDLKKVNLGTNTIKLLGNKGMCKNIVHLKCYNGNIFGIDVDGILSKIDPNTGEIVPLDTKINFQKTMLMTLSETDIWTVNREGTLYKTNFSNGKFDTVRVGAAGSFKDTWFMEWMDGYIWTIEKGTLYKIDPTDGGFFTLSSNWRGTKLFTVNNGFIYSIDSRGFLWRTETRIKIENVK